AAASAAGSTTAGTSASTCGFLPTACHSLRAPSATLGALRITSVHGTFCRTVNQGTGMRCAFAAVAAPSKIAERRVALRARVADEHAQQRHAALGLPHACADHELAPAKAHDVADHRRHRVTLPERRHDDAFAADPSLVIGAQHQADLKSLLS